MPKNSRQKFKYYENKQSFSDEIKSNFHHFWRAIIEANKKKYVILEGESPNLNAIVKVRRNSCDQVFWGMTLSKKIYHNSDGSSSHQLVLSYRYFSTNNKNENMEYYASFISFKSHFYSKQWSRIFLLFCSRSGVFIRNFELS